MSSLTFFCGDILQLGVGPPCSDSVCSDLGGTACDRVPRTEPAHDGHRRGPRRVAAFIHFYLSFEVTGVTITEGGGASVEGDKGGDDGGQVIYAP